MGDFFASGAQVYISGDLRYHDARDVEMAGRGLIDIGHFASEHLIVEVVAGKLADQVPFDWAKTSMDAEPNPTVTIKPAVAVPLMTTPLLASSKLTTSSSSIGCVESARSPATVSTCTASLRDDVLPAASVAVTTTVVG